MATDGVEEVTTDDDVDEDEGVAAVVPVCDEPPQPARAAPTSASAARRIGALLALH